jgi:hypothetical protein
MARFGFGLKGFALALVVGLGAQAVFAGWVVKAEMQGASLDKKGELVMEGTRSETTIKYDGEKSRSDFGRGGIIRDAATGDEIHLTHGSKMYLKVSKAKRNAAGLGVADGGKEAIKPKATGRKEKIGEWEAQEYVVEEDGAKYVFWMAPLGPEMATLREPLMRTLDGMYLAKGIPAMDYRGLEGYPVRTYWIGKPRVEEMPDGKKIEIKQPIGVRTVTGIKEEKIDASEFAPPAGYQEEAPMKMPAPNAGKR